MERLTYDFALGGNHCWQVKGADNLECREVCERQGDDGCKTCPIAKAFDRLAAYEETGLEPEEVTELCEMDRRAKMAEMLQLEESTGVSIERLRELAQADKNKCVIITPYPISEGVIEHDPVQLYRIINNKARPFEVDSLSISDGECTFEPCEPEHDGMRYGRENMGKDVFANCIDADEALRREQDEQIKS